MEPDELDAFIYFVDITVERQEAGLDTRGASSPETCTFCPFKMKCKTNARMIQDAMGVAEKVTEGTAFPDTIEQFYRSKKMIEHAFGLARGVILDDPDGFPEWRRSERRSARAWAMDRFDEAEIAHQIRLTYDVENPYKLVTPAAMMKMLPKDADLSKLLKPLTMHAVLMAPRKG